MSGAGAIRIAITSAVVLCLALAPAAGLHAAGGKPRSAGAPPARLAPRIDAVTAQARIGESIEILGEHLGAPGDPAGTQVLFFSGKNREPIPASPSVSSGRRLEVRVPRGALTGPIRVRTPGGEAQGARPFTPLYLFHVPPDIFATDGALAPLQLQQCSIKLADGLDRSALEVSPGMAAAGFRDVIFTFPAYAQAYDVGIGTLSVRIRLPGNDVEDRFRTLQTSRIELNVAGPNLVLTAFFESDGPEFVGEFESRTVLGRDLPWTPFLHVNADDLVVRATFPLTARGLVIGLGPVAVDVDFSFHVTALQAVRVSVDDATVKEYVAGTVRDRLKGFLNHEAYREPLSRALGLYLMNNPAFSGIIFNRLALAESSDGGFDLRALTSSDP